MMGVLTLSLPKELICDQVSWPSENTQPFEHLWKELPGKGDVQWP